MKIKFTNWGNILKMYINFKKEKKCKYCKKIFISPGRAIYCSPKCRMNHNYHTNPKVRERVKRESFLRTQRLKDDKNFQEQKKEYYRKWYEKNRVKHNKYMKEYMKKNWEKYYKYKKKEKK